MDHTQFLCVLPSSHKNPRTFIAEELFSRARCRVLDRYSVASLPSRQPRWTDGTNGLSYIFVDFLFTWRRLPGRWAGLAGSPVCRRWGSFWWWRSTWRVEWTSRAAPARTPRWRRRSPAFFPSPTDRSSPGFYRPLGTRCRMGSTWQDEEELKVRTSGCSLI